MHGSSHSSSPVPIKKARIEIIPLIDIMFFLLASFMLVSLSNAEQVYPELQRQLTRQYGLPFDFERPDRRLQQFTAAHGIRYLALMPALRDYHRRTGTYLHGFGSVITGHWNEAGHRQAAEQIFAFLKQRNLVPLD